MLVGFALWPIFFEMKGCWRLEMHQMTSQWPWTLHSQEYPDTQTTYLLGPNYTLRLAVLEIHDSRKSEMQCTEWPQTHIKHLSIKCNIHTNYLPPPPPGPKFGAFRFVCNCFRYARLQKIGNALKEIRIALNIVFRLKFNIVTLVSVENPSTCIWIFSTSGWSLTATDAILDQGWRVGVGVGGGLTTSQYVWHFIKATPFYSGTCFCKSTCNWDTCLQGFGSLV